MTNSLYLPMLSNGGSPLGSSASFAPTPSASQLPYAFESNATLNNRFNLRAGLFTDRATAGQGAPIVTLPLGERVDIDLQLESGWTWVNTSPQSKTLGRYAGRSGWVASRGIKLDLPPVGPVLGVPVTSVAAGVNEPLKPAGDELLSASRPSATARRLATVWNAYGNFVRAVARKLGIDYRAAVSVFVIEAGSRAYDEGGRMVIRVEAHLLERWGGDRAAWADHFARDLGAQAWVGHRVRFTLHGEWISYHGNNALEWQVIELASQLFGRDTAARATSMGLPQVLGDNCRALGYGNAAQMLAELQRSTHSQIAGFFDYVVRAKLIDEIQREDWTAFARSYNGSGQAETYGKLIGSVYAVARQLLRAD